MEPSVISLPGENAFVAANPKLPHECITTDAVGVFFQTFDELRDWLATLPDQKVDKGATGTCEIIVRHMFVDTPENRAFGEMVVASEMAAKIANELNKSASGEIVWRFPLEVEVRSIHVVEEWRSDGPFYECRTGRLCTLKTGNFAKMTAYCRVARLEARPT